jgi:hypothetical protein
MQVKQINTPLHTPLVTLLMHNLQAHMSRMHARATVRTTGKCDTVCDSCTTAEVYTRTARGCLNESMGWRLHLMLVSDTF